MCFALGFACTVSDRERSRLDVRPGDPEGPEFYGNDTAGGAPTGGGAGMEGFIDTTPPAPIDPVDTACVIAQEQAVLIKQPVDIIVLLDNSGSMADEADSVEKNINDSFADVLNMSQVDYRVILITRHRTEPRSANEEASTSVCVTMPLSNLPSCDDAPEPVFSQRFFQYSTKIESDDSFDIALDTYAPPFDDDEREEKYDHAPNGWSEWLRPEAKKVFLEVTDDDEDMSSADFAAQLVSLAPEHFATKSLQPNFVFHSIVGVAEKAQPTAAYAPDEPVMEDECTGNAGDVTSAGETYQELSRLTGGLRFPLCQFGAYDVVLQRIAEDVVLKRDVACDFDIPDAPAGLNLVLDNVAVAYSSSGTRGVTAQLGQARSVEDCQQNAFYIQEGAAPEVRSRLNLCPEACAQIRSDPLAAVSVLFTCKSQIIR